MFIRDFIDVNNDINYQYRTSKYPLFIKNIILNINRKRLKKMINKISNDSIPIDLLKEYFDMIILNYPPLGQYQHINSCKYSINGKGEYAVYFSFKNVEIDNMEFIVQFGLNGNTNNAYGNFCVIETGKYGNRQNRFFVEYKKFISKTNSESSMLAHDEIYKVYAQNGFVDIIVDDMKQFLLDMIERSERINQ